jgi:ferredoxin
MKKLRYIAGVASLSLDQSLCIGCRTCGRVCPHAVFSYLNNKAAIEDGDGCMECGACGVNCPVGAVSVNPGVG